MGVLEYKTLPMNIKKPIVLSLLVLFLLPTTHISAASAPEDDTRYFVQTTKSFWKSTLGVRHPFSDGFTTDLSDWQLRFAKIAGLKIYPVKKLSILPVDTEIDAKKPIRPSPTPPARFTPTSQISWGVQMIYGDTLIGNPSGGASVSVAVLDTGVFRDHLDLKNRIKECKDFTAPKQAVVDGKCEDKNGHGTHVAGIIAADGGSDHLGIYGVAPQADLLAYKVCGANGSCWSDDIAIAIKTAVDAGAHVINLSLGSDAQSSLITDAINEAAEKGVLVVGAAGNDGPYPDSIDYPAALVSVMSVGALDVTASVSEWSSRGINTSTTEYSREEKDIEVAAPGVNVESTWKDGNYVILSGTSMAAPHVAGLAAKLWRFDALKPAEATRRLINSLSVDLFPLGDDNSSGWGLPTL